MKNSNVLLTAWLLTVLITGAVSTNLGAMIGHGIEARIVALAHVVEGKQP